MNIVPTYRYLGIILDEHLTFTSCTKTLAESAGRALGGIISKSRTIKDLGFKTYSKLYEAGVAPIL